MPRKTKSPRIKLGFNICRKPPATGVPEIVNVWIEGFGWLRGGSDRSEVEVTANVVINSLDGTDAGIRTLIKYLDKKVK